MAVYEEVAPTAPLWMSKGEDSQPKKVTPVGHSLYLRHGVCSGMARLRNHFHIVVIIQRKSSKQRQKQIIRALQDEGIPFDALYQYEKEFNAGFKGSTRYFAMDRIISDTGYTPTQTIFLTAVDQSQHNVDINEYLEKD